MCRHVIKPKPHPIFGRYMEVFALVDIPAFAELFVRYGEHYWDHTINEDPVPDGRILKFPEYDRRMKEYAAAVVMKSRSQ